MILQNGLLVGGGGGRGDIRGGGTYVYEGARVADATSTRGGEIFCGTDEQVRTVLF